MSLPRVAIVGRPNVGKSTLFNALAGRRLSIEDGMAGVTRDRLSFVLGMGDKALELIDTGGIGIVDEDRLERHVDAQIDAALALADVVLFVFDAKEGLAHGDRLVAERLRRLDVPVLLVANKVEGRLDLSGVGEAHALGFGEPFKVSAREKSGLADLQDAIFELVGDAALDPALPSDHIRLAIMGRMNVGKSTLVNALVGESRVIVSDVPGTTRDAVDVPFLHRGRKFTAIDTAGLRKDKTVSDSVEFYGQARALKAVRRADVVLLLVDATREIGRIDRQLGGLVVEHAVPCVIVVTKWDLAQGQATQDDYQVYIRGTLRGLGFAPITHICAPSGQGLGQLLELAARLHDQAGQRVTTGELNRVLARAWEKRKPKPQGGRVGRIYYGSQVGTHPPELVLFVNDPDLFEDNWRRFLLHELQATLPYSQIPVKIGFQTRSGD